jgi:lambda repressor-like predicted transcriptional regulator
MKTMGKKGKHDSSVDTFRENLIAVMESKGVTISELSRRAKVQRSGLSRFIHGEFGCALEYAYKLAEAVETPLSELVDASHATTK